MKLRINEKETPNIEVKHEGILEVPEGKKVDELPYSHFEKLAKKKGLSKITRALNNLQVWNKNDDKELSKWAGNMIDKLNDKLKKDESLNRRKINEDLYSITYDIDSEDGYTYTEEEMFKGSWTDLQNLIKQMKSNGCYNIDANAIYDEEDFEESVKFKEASKKSYWKYYMNDPAIERIENSEYDKFDKNNIKKVKLYSCVNEEDCYEDDFSWAVCYYDRPNKAFFGDKEDAYIALMDYLNTSIYEKRNDL